MFRGELAEDVVDLSAELFAVDVELVGETLHELLAFDSLLEQLPDSGARPVELEHLAGSNVDEDHPVFETSEYDVWVGSVIPGHGDAERSTGRWRARACALTDPYAARIAGSLPAC